MPTMRLAVSGAMVRVAENFMPTIRLAVDSSSVHARNNLSTAPGSDISNVALLVSFFYFNNFNKKIRTKFQYRDYALDSGAFSAFNSGQSIDLQGYINLIKELKQTDRKLSDVFALDVIGDYKASRRNVEEMWRQGIEAIPCYHMGEPLLELKSLSANYPKIAIGGCARIHRTTKLQFAARCFDAVWPKKIHGFGFGDREAVLRFPFHSVDSTSWELGPAVFGRWQGYGLASLRGSKQNLRGEILYYLELEKEANFRWAKVKHLLD